MNKTFPENIKDIRTAVMASEVREAIAQGMEYVEQFANTAGENIQKAIDPTLSLSGKAADAKATGDAIQVVRDDLASEITRAKAAEKANADNLAAESKRAADEEQRLDTAITAEKARAEQAEKALDERVTALDGSLQALGLAVVGGKLCAVYKKAAAASVEGGAEG